MREALDDPENPAGSIYSHKYVYKALKLRNQFKGGKSVFMNPMQPIKCGGAPQKIMYINDFDWKQKGLTFETNFISATPILFPACDKFSKALNAICDERGITRQLGNTIQSIDAANRVAVFKNNATGAELRADYDFLHIVPPQSPP